MQSLTPQPSIPPTEVPHEREFETGVWAFFKAFALVGVLVVVVGWGAWQVVLHFWSVEARFTDPITGGHRSALEGAGFEIIDASYGPRWRDGPVNGAGINIDVRGGGCEPEDADCVREVFDAQAWVSDLEVTNARGSLKFKIGDPGGEETCRVSARLDENRLFPNTWHLFVEC